MTFNTNPSAVNQPTFQFDIHEGESMICPGAPRIPFDDVNWGSPSPPPSPGGKSHHGIESVGYTRVGLGIFGVSGPVYSNFNHTRTSADSSTPSTSTTTTTSSGASSGGAAVLDAEVKENQGAPKKRKQLQGMKAKGRDNSA